MNFEKAAVIHVVKISVNAANPAACSRSEQFVSTIMIFM